eukprot:scaffold234632_cov17-Tisochrysis_lutea.AAC.2
MLAPRCRYSFASSDSDKPQSYCNFIPCSNGVHQTPSGSKISSARGNHLLHQPNQDAPQAQPQSSITQQAGYSYSSSLQYKIGVHRYLQQKNPSNQRMTPDAPLSKRVATEEGSDPEQ